MLATIAAWATSTFLPLLLEWIFVDVLLAAATITVNDFFINVVIEGGFQDFTGLTTYLSQLANTPTLNGVAINLFSTIRVIAIFIIALNMIFAGIRMMTAPAMGRQAESPVAFFTRCVVAIVAIALYPTIIDGVTRILNAFLASPLFDVSKAQYATGQATGGANGILQTVFNIKDNNLGGILVGIAIAIVFLKDIAFAAIIYIERYASFALYLLLGPICIAMYPNEAQKNVFEEWLKGIVAQILTILVSIACITLFCRQVTLVDTGKAIGINHTVQLVFAMTLLELVKNSEQIVNMFGFKTIPSGDTARMFLGGFASSLAVFSKADSWIKKGKSNWQDAKTKVYGNGQAPKFQSKTLPVGGTDMGVTMNKGDSTAKLSGADIALNEIKKNGGKPLTDKQMEKLADTATGKTTPFTLPYEINDGKLKNNYGLGTKDRAEVLKGMKEANRQYKESNKTLSTDRPDAQACLNMMNDSNGLVGVGKASKLVTPSDKKGFSAENPLDDGSYMQGYMLKAKKAGQKDDEAGTYVQWQQVRQLKDGTTVPVRDANPNLIKEAQSMPIVPHQEADVKAKESMVNNIRNKEEYKGLTDEQLKTNQNYQKEVNDAMNDPYAFDKFNYNNRIENDNKTKANIENNLKASDKYKGFTDEQLQSNPSYQKDLENAYDDLGIQGKNTYSMPVQNVIGNESQNGMLEQLGTKELHGSEELRTNLGMSETPFDYARQEFVQNSNGDFELKTTFGNEIKNKNGESTSYSVDEKGNMHSSTKIDITGTVNMDKGEHVERVERPEPVQTSNESNTGKHSQRSDNNNGENQSSSKKHTKSTNNSKNDNTDSTESAEPTASNESKEKHDEGDNS